jgi:phosphoribosylglycinamide formyltransferase-1
MIRIAIFASGSGTNAQRISEYFAEKQGPITVALILSNNASAYVLERARNLGVPGIVFTRTEFYGTSRIPDILKENSIDYIVLAGFLWLIPDPVLTAYPGRILNIHPALLPSYGGKGMYGMKVHETIIASRERESGITIHLVNQKYDEGKILFQAKCVIVESDTAESLAEKIHELEYNWFPTVIEDYIVNSE